MQLIENNNRAKKHLIEKRCYLYLKFLKFTMAV